MDPLIQDTPDSGGGREIRSSNYHLGENSAWDDDLVKKFTQ